MKKTLLFLFCTAIMSVAMAQDVIVGWTFPSSIKTPDQGLAINATRFIGTENDTLRPIYFTTGQVTGDTAATTIGWHNGVGTKYWLVKFKTTGYKDIKISSKQRAGNQTGGGPKDFFIQWKKGSGSWANIIVDTIHCANDWTTGVVTNAAMPSGADTASSSLSVRWVMATDLNTSGTATDSLATSKIDEIIVTGTSTATGIEEVLYTASTTEVYPNPSTGIITINTIDSFDQVVVYNQIGAVVFEQKSIPTKMNIDLSQFGSGLYYVNLKNSNGDQVCKKIIIQ